MSNYYSFLKEKSTYIKDGYKFKHLCSTKYKYKQKGAAMQRRRSTNWIWEVYYLCENEKY